MSRTASRWRPSQRLAVAIVFVAGGFVTIMDGTIVNVALPSIGRDFHVAPTAVGGIAIGYMIAMAIVVPISGRLAHRFGSRRVFLSALALFMVASGLCGFATSLPELAAFRVIQGLGAGTLAPVGLSMLYLTFPPEERVRVSSFTMIPTLLAPASGPMLGGLLVSDLSWRWVFFVNVPIALLGIIFGILFVAELDDDRPSRRFDLAGFACSTSAIGLLMFGVSEGADLGWTDPVVLLTLTAGTVLALSTVVIELRATEPVLALRLFAVPSFRAASGVVAFTGAAFISTLFAISLYLQYGRGLGALQSGLCTFPEAIGVLCGGQISTRILLPLLGTRRLVTLGALGMATTIALLALMGSGTSLWWTRLIMVGVGLSTGQIFIATQVSAFSAIGPASTNAASTLFTSVRQVSGAAGIALLTTVAGVFGATRIAGAANDLSAFRWPFVFAAGLALAGAICAMSLTDESAHTRADQDQPSRVLDVPDERVWTSRR